VKPANIYLCREAFESDVVKILDFGLAKRIVPTPAPGASVDTRSDVIAGTPAYLAPEAISGTGTLDGRSDLYSLGCVAYWLLTGHLVFETDSAMGMMAAHLERLPTPPGALSPFKVPALLDELIMQCLSKSPDARPLSAEEVSSRLAAVELEAPWTSKDAAHWWNTHAPGLSS
jgi:serine/threonine-protein kinase